MTEVGCRGVINVGYLNLALAILKVVVKVDSIKLNTSGNKTSYCSGSIAVSSGGETVCNKDNSLDLILTEEGCGEIKGGGDVCTAVVNSSLLNASDLGAGGGQNLTILTEYDDTHIGLLRKRFLNLSDVFVNLVEISV